MTDTIPKKDVAEGAIHTETCAYWKSPWNQVPSGRECDSDCRPSLEQYLALEQETVSFRNEVREALRRIEEDVKAYLVVEWTRRDLLIRTIDRQRRKLGPEEELEGCQ